MRFIGDYPFRIIEGGLMREYNKRMNLANPLTSKRPLPRIKADKRRITADLPMQGT
jgi:hypothetical protein